jgi:hypothetical protein
MSGLLQAWECISETGRLCLTPDLSGPGIVPGFNDRATFAGPLGDLQKVLQGGDQAPGLEPGTLIDARAGRYFWAELSDYGVLSFYADLRGPEVDETNDRAIWTGTREDLRLVWRKGMQAPGCEPGVTFGWADLALHNDAGQMVFRGGLRGEGVDDSNNAGYWSGPPGGLAAVARAGDAAWGLGDGVLYGHPVGSSGFNTLGDVGYGMLLTGEGVTPENHRALWYRTAAGLHLIGREGDPVPEIGPDVEIDSIGTTWINLRREVFYRVKYRGDTIDDSNAWAMYFGPYEDPELTLRDGDPAPHFPSGTTLSRVVAASQLAAMNDAGDVVTATQIAGSDVTPDSNVVLWLRHGRLGQWLPLLRSGAIVSGRVVWAEDEGDFGHGFSRYTGGSDGRRQSFNDNRQLAIELEFTDGTHGVYLIEVNWPGDVDEDGDVDLADLAALLAAYDTCAGDPGYNPDADLDQDGCVDLSDLATLLANYGAGT